MTLKRWLPWVGCLLVCFGPVVFGDDAAPATQPAAAPATQPSAHVAEDARPLLDQLGEAYSKIKSLDLAGTMNIDVQVPEKKVNQTDTFTASYDAPNKFRHEMKEDILVGSTGAKLYVYKGDDNAYISLEAPKDRVAPGDLPRDVADLLEMQNPSLLLAVSKEPSATLLKEAAEVSKLDDSHVDGASYPALKLTMTDKSTLTLLLDPQTHLLKRSIDDETPVFQKRRPDLSRAIITIDYTKTSPRDARPDEQYAWAPPAGARDASASAAMQPGDDLPPEVAALVGKPAPTFKLPDLDGKDVALAEMRGHVVILDFWATWCGPCRMSLPNLNKLYEELNAKGLRVVAVDLAEEKGDVKDAAKEMKLTLPIVIDGGDVAKMYGVNPIPQTVIIGKDGVVLKAFVGVGPDTEEEIRKIVADAMAK